MRMFVAVPLPEAVQEDLAQFLEPRQEAGVGSPALRWTRQWHVTLAFMPEVADRHTDELFERLQRVAARRNPLVLRVAGAGAFPHAGRAKVLWAGVRQEGEHAGERAVEHPGEHAGERAGEHPGEHAGERAGEHPGEHEHEGEHEEKHGELARLAAGARAAAAKSGIEVAGGRFRPHLTLARLKRPEDVTRWLRVLDPYAGPPWQAREVALIASYLGQGPDGRPRHEVLETFELGPPGPG